MRGGQQGVQAPAAGWGDGGEQHGRALASSQLCQALGLPRIAMAGCVPEVLGDGGGDQGAGSPRLKQFNGTGEPAKPSIGTAGGGLSGLNAVLQRLVVDPECSGVSQGEV